MKKLTRAEEELMQLLWELGEANVGALIGEMKTPKPAYNTISTIARILVDKGFVDYRKKGKGHFYFPVVTKEEYSKFTASKLKDDYFGGSMKSMVSFFVKKKELDIEDLQDILNEINKNPEE